MEEENIKKNIWTSGRARNMDKNNLSGIEGDKDIDIVADNEKKRLV
jgi:hypothetical protein